MRSIEASELEKQIYEVLQEIQAQGEEVEITLQGQTIAHLVPVKLAAITKSAGWVKLDELAVQIGAAWPTGGVSAAEAVAEGRRDL